MSKVHAAVCGLVCLLLAACGGGGGGGSGSSSSSSGGGSSPPPPPAVGAFNLSGTAMTFRAPRLLDVPASEGFLMHVTGSGVANVSAAMKAGQVVSWLDVDIDGTSPDYIVTLRPNTTNLPVAIATTTVTVATLNAAGTVLATRDIQVTYDIYEGLSIVSTPAPQSFIYGGPETSTATFFINSHGRSYTVTSEDSIVSAPTGTLSGSRLITLGIDVSSLIPADWQGRVRVVAVDDPADYVYVVVPVHVAFPTIGVSSTSLVLGGDDGLGATLAGSLDLTLDTGPNTWPWTVEVQGFSKPAALTTPVTSGTLGGSVGGTFSLSADRAQLQPGTYTATLHFSAAVKNFNITRDVPLTVNWESQRLVPQYDGLSFYSNPSRAAPARQVVIGDSRGRTNIPWSATSDSPWLRITPTSGVTGATATIEVDPAGLATEALYNGHITLTSSNPSIERPETIRVGLWKGAAAPAAISKPLAYTSNSIVTSPVEPYLYSIARNYDPGQTGTVDRQIGGLVRVYNVFTGDLVLSFESGTTQPGSITISSDGTRLFVTDYAGPATLELDALSGSLLATHAATTNPPAVYDERHGIEFLRVDGRPVVWPAFSSPVEPIDVETGRGLLMYSRGPGGDAVGALRSDYFQAASPDGHFMYLASRNSSSGLFVFGQFFSVLDGGPRLRSVPGDYFGHAGEVADVCVGRDNKVWQSSVFLPMRAFDSNLANEVASFTMDPKWRTGNLICGVHGRNYVTIMDSTGSSDHNVAMFDDAGALLGTFRHGPAGGLIKTFEFKLSGDGTRIVWPTFSIVNNKLVDTLLITSVP